MPVPRSALVIGMAGAAFFLIAGIVGISRGLTVAGILFLIIGLAGIIGGAVLWQRLSPPH